MDPHCCIHALDRERLGLRQGSCDTAVSMSMSMYVGSGPDARAHQVQALEHEVSELTKANALLAAQHMQPHEKRRPDTRGDPCVAASRGCKRGRGPPVATEVSPPPRTSNTAGDSCLGLDAAAAPLRPDTGGDACEMDTAARPRAAAAAAEGGTAAAGHETLLARKIAEEEVKHELLLVLTGVQSKMEKIERDGGAGHAGARRSRRRSVEEQRHESVTERHLGRGSGDQPRQERHLGCAADAGDDVEALLEEFGSLNDTADTIVAVASPSPKPVSGLCACVTTRMHASTLIHPPRACLLYQHLHTHTHSLTHSLTLCHTQVASCSSDGREAEHGDVARDLRALSSWHSITNLKPLPRPLSPAGFVMS